MNRSPCVTMSQVETIINCLLLNNSSVKAVGIKSTDHSCAREAQGC